MLRLCYMEKGKKVFVDLAGDEVVLGRSPKADVVINDYGVSRVHAKVVRSGDGFEVQDSDSRNGTKLNDVRVSKARIGTGDRVALGNFVFQIVDAEESAERLVDVESGGDCDISPDSGTIIRSAEELERMLQSAGVSEGVKEPQASEIAQSNKILIFLTKVAKALISAERLDDILETVMGLVFEHLPAERGVLALYDGETLVPRVVRYRKANSEEEKITLPRAITNLVRRDKVSVLAMDAMTDHRFPDSASIFMLGIRSAMCVPLWQLDRVIGIIYIDEDVQAGTFNTDDLDLLSALGNYAAVAIERARLTEKVLEEQAIRAKLSRYHSPGVVEMIIKQVGSDDTLEMSKKIVSVSFTDLVGFTTLSEALEASELGVLLNRFFTEMTECIFKYEGTLDKYIGDCIMAVFGAPLDQPDHAVRCVRAALEMHRTLERLNTEVVDPSQRFNIRSAINSGAVVAGDIGSPKRKDYSVLGDTVNAASRLESSVAAPGQIVIGEETYQLVKQYFEIQSLGYHSLKGKRAQMAAYQVLEEKAGAF